MPFNKRIQWGTLLYCAAAVLLPNMFLFDLYNRNRVEISAETGHLLLFALVLGVVSVGIFVLLRFGVRSYEGALLVLAPFWIFFWLFETILSLFTGTGRHEQGEYGEAEGGYALASWGLFHILLMILSGIILFALLRYWLRNYKGAIVAFCIVVWLFATVTGVLSNQNWNQISRVVLFVGLYGFVILLALIFRRREIPFYKKDVVFKVLSLVICVLFIFNALPLTGLWGGGYVGNFELREGELFRTEFHVDRNLPSPDIYWFMPDGQITLADFETFFGGSQDEFRNFLDERDFILNENATFLGVNTRFGLPGQLSPAFYDSFLAEIFATFEDLPTRPRLNAVSNALRRQGLVLEYDVTPATELFNAFLQAGYSTVQIAPHHPDTHAIFNYFYRISSGGSNSSASQLYPLAIAGGEAFDRGEPRGGDVGIGRGLVDLIGLLTLDTPLSFIVHSGLFEAAEDGGIEWTATAEDDEIEWMAIDDHTEAIDALTQNTRNLNHERHLLQRVIDSQSISGPKLTFMVIYFTHTNRWHWQERGLSSADAVPRYDLYPAAFESSNETMMTIIDVILESNPNAVIVIQSDHGIHRTETHEALQSGTLGLTAEDTAHLHNSVLSAVRIPPQYGGLHSPLDPRNITRELVNRFVGVNYELLPQ